MNFTFLQTLTEKSTKTKHEVISSFSEQKNYFTSKLLYSTEENVIDCCNKVQLSLASAWFWTYGKMLILKQFYSEFMYIIVII